MDKENVSNIDLYNLLLEVKKKNEELQIQNNNTKEEIKQEIRSTKIEIFQELANLKQENNELKKENQILKYRLLNCERKLKKFNLIFYGLQEEEEELVGIQNILDLINQKLNIDCNFSDIRDIYRIGQKTADKNRPTVVEFINYKLRTEILANSKKLKGTGIFITNDYTPEDYEKHKILIAHLKTARSNNHHAVIKNNVLIINGDKYTCEDLENNEYILSGENKKVESAKIKEKPQESTPNKPGSSKKETNKKEQENTLIPTELKSPIQEEINKKRKQTSESDNPIKRSNRLKK